ncbi:signal peptidase II [Myxococcota bacterium]|nr:signal peptidase II [Myxococcota bacterium]MBU1428951.1 signal peptidase II [Myxococcota bacterium]MBU1897707.1 signal peptidase II [Myxococcota bacterium]
MRRSYLLLGIGSIITIILDQWSKIAAIKALSVGPLPTDSALIRTRLNPVFESWFNLRLAGNKGAAWGLFRDLPDGWRVPFFVIISVVAIVAIVMIYRRAQRQPFLQWALTLILGGTIGNLIDRIRFGYVIDFIDWFYQTHHWPTFNIADVAITLGVIFLAIDMYQQRKVEADAAEMSA